MWQRHSCRSRQVLVRMSLLVGLASTTRTRQSLGASTSRPFLWAGVSFLGVSLHVNFERRGWYNVSSNTRAFSMQKGYHTRQACK